MEQDLILMLKKEHCLNRMQIIIKNPLNKGISIQLKLQAVRYSNFFNLNNIIYKISIIIFLIVF